uniref:Uncharacterized protein n=1 Tax=Amphimedon queenslandica TaxID=400682 RepID=A0A1X7T6L1_AMPQE
VISKFQTIFDKLRTYFCESTTFLLPNHAKKIKKFKTLFGTLVF